MVNTGTTTEVGKISVAISSGKPPPTSLQVKLDRLGKWLVVLTFLACGLFVGAGLARGLGGEVIEAGISLAVSVVPEGLVVVVTLTMAHGMRNMAANNAIVRKMPAVETLGAVTSICSDKTGTLTEGVGEPEIIPRVPCTDLCVPPPVATGNMSMKVLWVTTGANSKGSSVSFTGVGDNPESGDMVSANGQRGRVRTIAPACWDLTLASGCLLQFPSAKKPDRPVCPQGSWYDRRVAWLGVSLNPTASAGLRYVQQRSAEPRRGQVVHDRRPDRGGSHGGRA